MATKLMSEIYLSHEQRRVARTILKSRAVESASVIEDRETGRSRGFGFVEMATPERRLPQLRCLTDRILES